MLQCSNETPSRIQQPHYVLSNSNPNLNMHQYPTQPPQQSLPQQQQQELLLRQRHVTTTSTSSSSCSCRRPTGAPHPSTKRPTNNTSDPSRISRCMYSHHQPQLPQLQHTR
ncbi:GL17634 [Drosophila persimilis]|uniref:GL17634 n=1 Tax=Drosophila persimilis TaxID=7234 RepID=B4GI21_DROPE|nr:GL17634 [Drosophila persimilis]